MKDMSEEKEAVPPQVEPRIDYSVCGRKARAFCFKWGIQNKMFRDIDIQTDLKNLLMEQQRHIQTLRKKIRYKKAAYQRLKAEETL